ncbi:hypothetical protein [Helicobacter bizzozeronii]|uniref:hypothetical protein n=1 Tax=Helicobacter bizzozeronii TaxID=56877 RepID=UPI000CF09286|nr:hypothetical protein [Helicobacter bizzozeronii]
MGLSEWVWALALGLTWGGAQPCACLTDYSSALDALGTQLSKALAPNPKLNPKDYLSYNVKGTFQFKTPDPFVLFGYAAHNQDYSKNGFCVGLGTRSNFRTNFCLVSTRSKGWYISPFWLDKGLLHIEFSREQSGHLEYNHLIFSRKDQAFFLQRFYRQNYPSQTPISPLYDKLRVGIKSATLYYSSKYSPTPISIDAISDTLLTRLQTECAHSQPCLKARQEEPLSLEQMRAHIAPWLKELAQQVGMPTNSKQEWLVSQAFIFNQQKYLLGIDSLQDKNKSVFCLGIFHGQEARKGFCLQVFTKEPSIELSCEKSLLKIQIDTKSAIQRYLVFQAIQDQFYLRQYYEVFLTQDDLKIPHKIGEKLYYNQERDKQQIPMQTLSTPLLEKLRLACVQHNLCQTPLLEP